jgi:hypothetical protein
MKIREMYCRLHTMYDDTINISYSRNNDSAALQVNEFKTEPHVVILSIEDLKILISVLQSVADGMAAIKAEVPEDD